MNYCPTCGRQWTLFEVNRGAHTCPGNMAGVTVVDPRDAALAAKDAEIAKLREELEDARKDIAERERQLRNALGLAACGKNGTGYHPFVLEDGRIIDVVESMVSASEWKPDRPELVPLPEARAFLARMEAK